MKRQFSTVTIGTVLSIMVLSSLSLPTVLAQNTPPNADAGRDFTVAVGELVEFHGTGTDSDGRIDLYEWDFEGTGSYDWSNTQNGDSSWTYQSLGTFNAVLRVTDNDGATDTDILKVTVIAGNEPPTADPGPDQKVHAKELVNFVGVGDDPDGKIVWYKWDFDGDGTFDYKSQDTGETAWIYTVPDTYYVTFYVEDDGIIPANASETIKVVVYDPNRPPLVNAGADIEVHARSPAHFDGEAQDIDGRIVKYEWDFNEDGKTDQESKSTGKALWTYDTPGTYIAKLTVTDDAELPSVSEDTVTVSVIAENKPPSADSGVDVTVTEGEPLEFKGKGTDDDGNVKWYKWDFDNDGTYDWASTENGNTIYIYLTPGEYTARLMVLDDVGAGANSTKTVTVEAKKKVVVKEPPLLEINLGFIIALIIGLGIGLAAGLVGAYGYLKITIAKKYSKVNQYESGGRTTDAEANFRGTQIGEREPPMFRGGGQI